MEKKISVKDLLMQAFLTGWELSDKSISQDEYLQSAIQVIEVLQVEPENIYAEEGLGLTDGDEVDHLDDLLRADGQMVHLIAIGQTQALLGVHIFRFHLQHFDDLNGAL